MNIENFIEKLNTEEGRKELSKISKDGFEKIRKEHLAKGIPFYYKNEECAEDEMIMETSEGKEIVKYKI